MTKKYNIDHENTIHKPDFIKLVAQDAGFTVTDTKIFWESVERIFARSLLAGKILNIGGFGKLYVKDIPEVENAYDHINKKRYTRKPSKRIVFVIASTFKNLLKDNNEEG